MLVRRRAAVLLLSLAACRSPASGTDAADTSTAAPPAADALDVVPDEGELPKLRTGTATPTVNAAVEAKVIATGATKTHHYLEFELPGLNPHRAVLDGGDGVLLAVSTRGLIARIPADKPWPAALKGSVWTQNWERGGARWARTPFTAETQTSLEPATGAVTRWNEAFPLGQPSWSGPAHPFLSFARGRLEAVAGNGRGTPTPPPPGFVPPRPTDLAQLMGTLTASMSLQESLQHDRGLRLTQKQPRNIAVDQLVGPTLKRHPFEEMMGNVDASKAVPEPLAAFAPAQFWYLRFSDIRLMLRTLDEADAWVTPVAQVLQENAELKNLSARYQRQLGLRRTALAKTLGHTVVDSLAVVGSDPYLREGSDVSIIFSVKQRAVFDGELAGHLKHWDGAVGGLTRTETSYRGHTLVEHADANRAVRQQRVDLGETTILSNSRGAVERILDAVDGRSPKLSEQADLRYMLARDPGAHDALAFLSDAFIETVIGPGQKVGEARRQQALADLLTPGYAALLHGWLHGTEPANTEALIKAGYFFADELEHDDGTAISFAPGVGARSSYGTPADLTPLLDLPPVTTVSEAEKTAYEAFARGYQQNWTTFVDPVAITLDISKQGAAEVAKVTARILPLIEATDYDDVRDVVGEQHVAVPTFGPGAGAVWAVGADTRLRGQLDGMAKSFSPDGKLGISWLGEWVAFGVFDRAAILETTWFTFDEVQLPRERTKDSDGEVDRQADDLELARRVGRLPVYAMADVGNPAGLVAALSAIKGLATSVAPGMVAWGEHSKHGDVPIVRIGVSKTASDPEMQAFADVIALYYAQAGGALVMSLREDVVKGLIDRAVAKRLPDGTTKAPDPQFVFQAQAARGGPLWTASSWMLQAQALRAGERAAVAAEVLLRGAPSTVKDHDRFEALALAYFGAIPLTGAGGTTWGMTPEGASDPVFGSTIQPTFVDLPVKGSPMDHLMQRLTAMRGEVAFDKEPGPATPPAYSLRTSFELTLVPAKP